MKSTALLICLISAADVAAEPLQPTLLHTFTTGGRLDSFAFDHAGKVLATAGWASADEDLDAWKAGTYPGDLRLFDVVNGQEIARFEEDCGALFDVAISPDGQSLATAGRVLGSANLGEVRIWNIALRKTMITISGQNRWTCTISYSPDGKLLAAGSQDGLVRIWDARTGKEIKALRQPSNPVSLAFSADGKTLVTGCGGGTVIFWDVANWNQRSKIEDNNLILWCAALSPNGQLLACCGSLRANDGGRQVGVTRIWDLATGKQRREWQADNISYNVAFSPDGQFIAGAALSASVWDVATGDEVLAVPRRRGSTSSDRIRFSPDGTNLAIGAYRRMQLFDIRDDK